MSRYHFLIRLSPDSLYNNTELYKDDKEQRVFTFVECCWFTWGTLTPYGSGNLMILASDWSMIQSRDG